MADNIGRNGGTKLPTVIPLCTLQSPHMIPGRLPGWLHLFIIFFREISILKEVIQDVFNSLFHVNDVSEFFVYLISVTDFLSNMYFSRMICSSIGANLHW